MPLAWGFESLLGHVNILERIFAPRWVVVAWDGHQEPCGVYLAKWMARYDMNKWRKEEPHVIFTIERITPQCSVAQELGHLSEDSF